MLRLYTSYHLNLSFSSIREDQRPEVIERCYWPLLRLADSLRVPIGIEASGYTLETISSIDVKWLYKLKELLNIGLIEFVGSGYVQLIGPLVPAEVNAANLRIGHKIYEKLLGFRPEIALVNEQAYSSSLVQHYLDANYRAIIMEWDNPARYQEEWLPEYRYLPQYAQDQFGNNIPLIWNYSIAFQKYQRYVHGDIEIEDYMSYLREKNKEGYKVFPLYLNDVEIFDFRPGRYQTEAIINNDEWKRVEDLFELISNDTTLEIILPSKVLDYLKQPGAGHILKLETPQQPIPVKKQEKYNITRWSVTGRNDLQINTSCYRIYQGLLQSNDFSDDKWMELCYLWSSDFRTHIEEKRWNKYLIRLSSNTILAEYEQNCLVEANEILKTKSTININYSIDRPLILENEKELIIDSSKIKVSFDYRRGLAMKSVYFKEVCDASLIGTLPHGTFDDIALGVDYYSGHTVVEIPGQHKVTDLSLVKMINSPIIEGSIPPSVIYLRGKIDTPLGTVHKTFSINLVEPSINIQYEYLWPKLPLSSVRTGFITLMPDSFHRETLFYGTHNGGLHTEKFYLNNCVVDHGQPVSALVSASHGLGATEGYIEFGDMEKALIFEINCSIARAIPMFTYKQIKQKYLARIAFSLNEIDDTAKDKIEFIRKFEFKIRATKYYK